VGKPSLNAAQPYAKAEGRVFLLVPAYPGCPGTKAVKQWLLSSSLLFAKLVLVILLQNSRSTVSIFLPFMELFTMRCSLFLKYVE